MAVEFHPSAEQEMGAAAEFYERRREGLGQALVDEVRAFCTLLSEHPEIGRPVDAIHRSVPLRKFPFVLFYRVRGDTVHRNGRR